MSLTGMRSIGQQIDRGRFVFATYFKLALANPGSARWVDGSYGSGIPKFNAYPGAPLESTPLIGSGNNGIFTGADTGQPKYLAQWTAYFSGAAPLPAQLLLCDFLMFYPLVDCDDDTLQEMVNTTSLPRYSDGAGVQMFMVSTVANTANANCTVNFTDQSGTARSTTFTFASANAGTLSSSTASNAPGFIPLGAARGVRSVQSLQFAAPCGGFAALVLVRPLVSLMVLEQDVPAEKSFGPEWCNLPSVLPGAYLNLLINAGSANGINLRSDFLFTF